MKVLTLALTCPDFGEDVAAYFMMWPARLEQLQCLDIGDAVSLLFEAAFAQLGSFPSNARIEINDTDIDTSTKEKRAAVLSELEKVRWFHREPTGQIVSILA